MIQDNCNKGISEIIWDNGTSFQPPEGHQLIWSTNPAWINEHAINENGQEYLFAQHSVDHIRSIKLTKP